MTSEQQRAGPADASNGPGATAARSSALVDTHTHFYDPTRPQGVPWPSKENKILYRKVLPADFQTLAEPLGVTGTVVVEASPWVEDNRWVLDLLSNHPFLLGFVGNLDPGAASFDEHWDRFAQDRRFLGIRIGAQALARGIGDASFLDRLKRVSDADRALDVLGDARMLPDAVRLAARLPGLRIVLDHLPFDPPADKARWAETDRAFEELRNHPHVYAKVSNVLRRTADRVETEVAFHRERLDQIWQVFGAERAIYGSNWPVSDQVAPYAEVLKIVREYVRLHQPQSAEAFFHANARRVYRWP